MTEQGIPTFTSSSGQVTGALTGSTTKWQIARVSGVASEILSYLQSIIELGLVNLPFAYTYTVESA